MLGHKSPDNVQSSFEKSITWQFLMFIRYAVKYSPFVLSIIIVRGLSSPWIWEVMTPKSSKYVIQYRSESLFSAVLPFKICTQKCTTKWKTVVPLAKVNTLELRIVPLTRLYQRLLIHQYLTNNHIISTLTLSGTLWTHRVDKWEEYRVCGL